MAIEVLTALLLIVTGFYAWVTYRILKANEATIAITREQMVAQMRPYVTIRPTMVVGNPLLRLVIGNSGRTAATNVRLQIDRDFYQFGDKSPGKNLAEFMMFKQPIETLAPGSETTVYLAQGYKVLGKGADPNISPAVFNITASYSYDGKAVTETTTVDLRPLANAAIGENPVETELRKLRQGIDASLDKLIEAVREVGERWVLPTEDQEAPTSDSEEVTEKEQA